VAYYNIRQLGEDAKAYQVRAVARAIEEAKK
jgi:hypothetical protein